MGDWVRRRDDLISNDWLACASVRVGLHKHLIVGNASLLAAINDFAAGFSPTETHPRERHSLEKMVKKGAAGSAAQGSQQAQQQGQHAQQQGQQAQQQGPASPSHAPKALADIVEAVMGAVFVDSGGDLQATYQVIMYHVCVCGKCWLRGGSSHHIAPLPCRAQLSLTHRSTRVPAQWA